MQLYKVKYPVCKSVVYGCRALDERLVAEASWWLFGGSAALQRSPVPHLETLLWAALEMWLVQLGRRAADHLQGTTGNTLHPSTATSPTGPGDQRGDGREIYVRHRS